MTMTAPPTAPAQRRPLPAGAAGWSRVFVDERGLPQQSDTPVPVDADGRRTAHVRHTCPGAIEVKGVRRPCDAEMWLQPTDPARFCPDHGSRLNPEAGARAGWVPWEKLARAAEAPARPLWVLAAEAAAGIGGHVGDVSPALPLAATPVLAGVAYGGVRVYLTARAVRAGSVSRGQKSGRRVDTIRRRARLGAYLGAAAGTWLTAATVADPGSVPGKVVWLSLPVGWAVGAYPWWRYLDRRRNRPPVHVAPEPVAAVAAEPSRDELDAADAAARWAEHVGAPNTALDVASWRRIACGWQAVVVATKPGALNRLGGDAAKATVRTIAGAYDVPKSAITWIEEHDDSPNRALLLVQPSNPLREGQVWAGPDTIRITDRVIESDTGRLIDGSGLVDTMFRFGWGAPSEVALGTTGGGKSMRARKRLVVERWASYVDPTGVRRGLFLSFLHDPKRLESYAEFRNAVHGYGITRDDAHLMIDAFLREMFRRYDMLASIEWRDEKGRLRHGGVAWDPRVHGPIISVVWDEFHELAKDAEFVAKLEKLARYQRACGMRAMLLSHMGTIGDTGSQALRDMLAGGRATLFRTTSALNAALATGGQLTADPRALPKVPGMCLVADGETATLMGRESWIPTSVAEARAAGVDRTLYDWLFDDDNNPIGFPAVIPPETVEAFGPEFMEWMVAGRSPRGRDGWSYTGVPAAAPGEVSSAQDALRRILFEAGRPVSRREIAEHRLWVPRSVTSTLTAALTAGREASPPWAVRSGDGPATRYELAPWMCERMAAEREESAE